MTNKEEAEKWAELLLNHRETIESAENKEFMRLVVYGNLSPIPPNTMIKLEDGTVKFESLTRKQVVEKYGYLMTEEDKKKFLE